MSEHDNVPEAESDEIPSEEFQSAIQIAIDLIALLLIHYAHREMTGGLPHVLMGLNAGESKPVSELEISFEECEERLQAWADKEGAALMAQIDNTIASHRLDSIDDKEEREMFTTMIKAAFANAMRRRMHGTNNEMQAQIMGSKYHHH